MQQTFVIVGAGQVAATAVESLRREGYGGRLVVVGDEPEPPYQRPPLSKKYLAGELPRERLAIKPLSFYEHARAELTLGTRATRLDPAARELGLDSGSSLRYDRLLLATGSAPRRIAVPGSELGGLYYLRTAADAAGIRAELARPGRRVVVVGGGYIGLEVAASCRTLGHEVLVLEMADRVMNRVVAPGVSAFFTAEHARAGVHIETGTFVSGFTARRDAPARVGAVHTRDGREFAADVVVVGIGVLPVAELAAAAGIACEDGIAVDEYCRSSDPDVYAAGDCASHPSLRYGRRVRLESVDNAFEQARSAAANMAGRPLVHDKVPWFWSDQYDLKLLIVGLNADHDLAVLRGRPGDRSFSCCYLREGELLAVDCVNNPRDYMAARKLIAERAHLDTARLHEPALPLRDLVI
jgi:3-phenylpropionate/trans-cinnamate dioxygenase ferredoxin reductase subunit